jgi:excisionase family DNA binding protein
VAYRPREVAEMVGMSESGVRNLIKRGTLRAVQLDGRWLIPAAAIEDKLSVSLDASPPPTLRRFALDWPAIARR